MPNPLDRLKHHVTGAIGDTLADAARYSERDVYRGDDGKVYIR